MSNRVVILAGGKCTRLYPYTVSLPKPLVPIGDIPILEFVIKKLKIHGFDHITITVNHQADVIKAYFGNGEKLSVNIDYSLEEKALSTMGPLTSIDDLPDNFLAMNGDVLSNLNFREFFNEHLKSGNLFTISAIEKKQKCEFGVLKTDVNKIVFLGLMLLC